MNDLNMNEPTFSGVIGNYLKRPFFVGMDASDLEDVFHLVYDLLEAEVDAMKVSAPYAKNTIAEYEDAMRTIRFAQSSFCDAFEEVCK